MAIRNPETGKSTSRTNPNMKSEIRAARVKARREKRKAQIAAGTYVPKTEDEKKNVEWAKAWRFKVGNKMGARTAGKFRKPISDRYREAIEVLLPERERKEMSLPPGSTLGDAIGISMAIRAIEGRQAVQAASEIREAIEGKATQPVDVNFLNDLPARLKKARTKLEQSK